ncbi:hypothetical protein Tco_1293410, partial [Tanacetum coccineum]
DRGNINKTQSKATPNEPSSLGTSSGGGPRRQDTTGDIITQTRVQNVSKTSNDSLLARVNTPRSDEDRLKLNDLMEFFNKLEKKGGSRTHKLKRLYKVGRSARVISSDEASLGDQEDSSKQGRKIDDIDKDVEITLVHKTQWRYGDEEMFDTGVLDGDVVLAEPKVTVKDVNLSVDEVTLAQALAALKSVKVQEKANVVEEPSESITTTPTLTTTTTATIIAVVSTRPKDKGLVIHEEEQATTPTFSSQQPSQVKAHDKGKGIMVEEPMKLKKKDQISLDEELAFKLQTEEEEEEERLARVKPQREEEANIVSWDKCAKNEWNLIIKMAQLNSSKNNKRTMRAQEERNKPPTKAQKRITMSTYLKNMVGYKHNQLKNKSFDDIHNEVRAEGSETRAEEVVLDKEEVATDAIPLATKPPSIVDYKIYKEGNKTYYQIIRADGTKHGPTRPEEGYERVLWGDLKIMFDPHVKDQVWRDQSDYRVLD